MARWNNCLEIGHLQSSSKYNHEYLVESNAWEFIVHREIEMFNHELTANLSFLLIAVLQNLAFF